MMHKNPQNRNYVASSGQTLTTSVSSVYAPKYLEICHPIHVLCGRTTFVLNQLGTKLIRSLGLL